jgi:hypothetical protein
LRFDIAPFLIPTCDLVISDFDFANSHLTKPANGLRYPRVGGTRQRHFAGTNFEPRELPENAATPTRRVHAVLGVFTLRKTPFLKSELPTATHHFYSSLDFYQILAT